MLITRFAASELRRRITNFLKAGDNAVAKTMDEILEEIILSVEQEFRDITVRMHAIESGDAVGRLVAQLEDPQFGRLLRNFWIEATREATDERRAMLVATAGGAAAAPLTIAQKARVERALRELDPWDVRVLGGLFRVCTPAQTSPHLAAEVSALRFLRWEAHQADSLVSAGCVRITVGGGGFGTGPRNDLAITELGHHVLRISRPFLREFGPGFAIDERDAVPTDPADRITLDGEEALMDLVAWVRLLAGRSFYHQAGTGGPPARAGAETQMVLVHHRIAPEDVPFANRLAERIAATGGPISYAVDPGAPTGTSESSGTLKGPHRLLRLLADDVDAEWT